MAVEHVSIEVGDEQLVKHEEVDEDAVSVHEMNKTGEQEIPENEIPVQVVNHGKWTRSLYGQKCTINWWRLLDGNFKYLFNGKFITGPEIPYAFFRCVLHYIACLVSFCIFEFKPLLVLYPVMASCTLAVLVISFLLLVYNGVRVIITEPGFIERPVWEDRYENVLFYHVDRKTGVEFIKPMMFNGQLVDCKFCLTCCNYRPPKAEHCKMTDSCIERYDHYSGVFGTSVGLRNIGYLVKFLFFANVVFFIIEGGAFWVMIYHILEYGWTYGLTYSPTTCIYASGLLIPPFLILTIPRDFFRHLYFFALDETNFERGQRDANLEAGTSLSTKLTNLMRNVYNLVLKSPPVSKIKPHQLIVEKLIRRQTKKIGQPNVRTPRYVPPDECQNESDSELNDEEIARRQENKKHGIRIQKCRNTLPSVRNLVPDSPPMDVPRPSYLPPNPRFFHPRPPRNNVPVGEIGLYQYFLNPRRAAQRQQYY